MPLKVELKPNERIIIGACVITNTDQRARLLIEGDNIPILREKDILTPATADTPAKLIYLAVQLMYISPDPQVNHGTYFNLVRDVVTAVPSAWPIIEGINNNILNPDGSDSPGLFGASGVVLQGLHDGGPQHALDAAHVHQRGRHHRARRARRDGGDGPAFADGATTLHERRLGLRTHGEGRVLVGADQLRGIDDVDAGGKPPAELLEHTA